MTSQLECAAGLMDIYSGTLPSRAEALVIQAWVSQFMNVSNALALGTSVLSEGESDRYTPTPVWFIPFQLFGESQVFVGKQTANADTAAVKDNAFGIIYVQHLDEGYYIELKTLTTCELSYRFPEILEIIQQFIRHTAEDIRRYAKSGTYQERHRVSDPG